MNVFKSLGMLLSDPAEYYREYTGDLVGLIKLSWWSAVPTAILILVLASMFGGVVGVPGFSIGAAAIGILAAIFIGIPIAISIQALIYHVGVLMMGGREIKKTANVFAGSMPLLILYGFVSTLLGTIPVLSVLISVIAFIHILIVEFAGLNVIHDLGAGKSIFVLIVTPILWMIVFGVLFLGLL